jgi:lysophospholipid acyltransferase (LPLAT)-like uncharacterized protein
VPEGFPLQSQPAPRTSRVVTPRKLKWRHHLAALAISTAFRIVSCTWRLRFVDEHGVLQQSGGPVIFCCWHNRLALSMRIWARVQKSAIQSAGLVALISASHDGGVLARTLQYFGVQAVRGSSSRRGAQALLELTSWTSRGYSVAITPDGPRGPCYRISEGAIGLAQVSELPIVPVSSHVRWKLSTKSWDRFQIPLPFARCEIRIGEPWRVPRTATDAERQQAMHELKTRLDQITED